jgi:hypothetical protein
MITRTTILAGAMLAMLTACAPVAYLACPGTDLHHCEGLSKEQSHLAAGAGLTHDADGIKDGDHGLPDGHGGTYEGRRSDPDEKGDNGGGPTEH